MKQVSSFAPGKVIISGEHSVVFGEKALVSTIDRGIEVTFSDGLLPIQYQHDRYLQYIFNIWQSHKYPFFNNFYLYVHSSLPQNTGLGSSASFASAVFQNLAKWFEVSLAKDKLFNLVWQAENAIHMSSSGLDPMVVVYQGFIAYQPEQIHNQIKTRQKQQFLLINSGAANEFTGEMVNMVKSNFPSNIKLIKEIGQITKIIIEKIEKNQPYTKLIQINQKLLDQLGVVSNGAREMINQIESLGGAAKITGAGGVRTGSGMILAIHQNLYHLTNLAKQNNWQYLEISI